MNLVAELIDSFDPAHLHFRPTEIFNENWLLKLFLHQLSQVELDQPPFVLSEGATWFSEASLPTAFKPRYRGDKRGESRTNADGVIGHFQIGVTGKTDLVLNAEAQQFTVIEAKISSSLSSGIRNVPGFDQAARNVACMAEVLRQAKRRPEELAQLAFIVLAPQAAIDSGRFAAEMDKAKMIEKVRKRVAAYEGELDAWYENWGKPTLKAIALHLVSWEASMTFLSTVQPEVGQELNQFYEKCLTFN